MLRPLPMTTIGDIARHGLELHVYCSRCHATRRIPIDSDERLRARNFATARFRCRSGRANGEVCGCHGSVEIEPIVLLPVGGEGPPGLLSCGTCLPPWEINYVPIDRPPWSVVKRERDDRFKCPGCHRAVAWRIHGPTWRPTYSRGAAATSTGAVRPR